MSKLSDFRKQYPMYDDMSDQQLADSLHKKFYSDLPKDEYYSKLGFKPEQPKGVLGKIGKFGSDIGGGLSNVASDVGSSLSGAPDALINSLKSLPDEAYESGKQVIRHPIRALENVGAGLAESAKGAYNLPLNINKYLGEKGFPIFKQMAPFIDKLRIGDTGLQQAVLGEEKPGDALIQSLSSLAPYGKIGALAKGAEGVAGRAAGMGAYAAGQNQDPLQAALIGAAGEAIPRSVASVKNLAPSRMFRGELTPDQLRDNLRAAEGTNTPLGSVIENPGMKHLFENIISNVPFSNARSALNKVKSQVDDQAGQVLKTLEPQNLKEEDPNSLVQSMLNSAYEKQKKAKNSLYKERDKIAEEEGHQLNLPKFKKLSKETAESIEGSPLYMDDPEFRKAWKKVSGFAEPDKRISSTILDSRGAPLTSKTIKPSLTEATMISGKLMKQGKQMSSSPNAVDRSLGGLYQRLGGTLKSDIEDSIQGGSDKLKEAHKTANKNYKKDFLPFLDDNVYKWTTGQKDPQAIVHEIIKPGAKQDRYRDIEKVNSLLPEGKKNLLGYTYLKGAEDHLGDLNPKKMAALVRSLGKRQFKALFPEETTRRMLTDFGNLRGMNEEALGVLHNPKTGARNMEAILGGVQGGLALSHPAAMLLPSLVSRQATKYLTSPKVRKKIVDKMIKHANKGESSKADTLAKSFSKALVANNESKNKKHKPMELELVGKRGN